MEVNLLKPTRITENELKSVLSIHPELLVKVSKTLAQDLQIDENNHLKADLVLTTGQTLLLVKIMHGSSLESNLFECACLFNKVNQDTEIFKENFGLKSIHDVEVIMILPELPENLTTLKLFKIEFPLRLYKYNAYENDKKELSVLFDEIDLYNENAMYSNNGNGKNNHTKTMTVVDPMSLVKNDGLKELLKNFLDQIVSNCGDEVKVDEKRWGYSIKKGRKALMIIGI